MDKRYRTNAIFILFFFSFFVQHYVNGSNQEIDDSMILQMIGRAGRQQYNTSGRVYIMTSAEKKVSKKNIFFQL